MNIDGIEPLENKQPTSVSEHKKQLPVPQNSEGRPLGENAPISTNADEREAEHQNQQLKNIREAEVSQPRDVHSQHDHKTPNQRPEGEIKELQPKISELETTQQQIVSELVKIKDGLLQQKKLHNHKTAEEIEKDEHRKMKNKMRKLKKQHAREIKGMTMTQTTVMSVLMKAKEEDESKMRTELSRVQNDLKTAEQKNKVLCETNAKLEDENNELKNKLHMQQDETENIIKIFRWVMGTIAFLVIGVLVMIIWHCAKLNLDDSLMKVFQWVMGTIAFLVIGVMVMIIWHCARLHLNELQMKIIWYVIKIAVALLVIGVKVIQIWHPDLLHPWIRFLSEELTGTLGISIGYITGVPFLVNLTTRLSEPLVIGITMACIGYYLHKIVYIVYSN